MAALKSVPSRICFSLDFLNWTFSRADGEFDLEVVDHKESTASLQTIGVLVVY